MKRVRGNYVNGSMNRARAPVRNRLRIRKKLVINIYIFFHFICVRDRINVCVFERESDNLILEKVSISNGGFCKKKASGGRL